MTFQKLIPRKVFVKLWTTWEKKNDFLQKKTIAMDQCVEKIAMDQFVEKIAMDQFVEKIAMDQYNFEGFGNMDWQKLKFYEILC